MGGKAVLHPTGISENQQRIIGYLLWCFDSCHVVQVEFPDARFVPTCTKCVLDVLLAD